jgi:hypothetical protein
MWKPPREEIVGRATWYLRILPRGREIELRQIVAVTWGEMGLDRTSHMEVTFRNQEEIMDQQTTSFPVLDRLLGLHQVLEVFYVVDGFEAELRNEEGYPPSMFRSHGFTIELALSNLEELLVAKGARLSPGHGVDRAD